MALIAAAAVRPLKVIVAVASGAVPALIWTFFGGGREVTPPRCFSANFYTTSREIFFGIITQKGSLNTGKNVKDMLPVCTPVSELA